MQLSGGWWVAIALAVIILGMVISATFVSTFLRETSGIEERWANKTLADRGILVNQIESLPISSNIATSGGYGPPSGSGDFDNDGLIDSEDPDSTNPDTDGDGTVDGEDPDPTDPNNPENGGSKRRPPSPGQPTPPSVFGDLQLKSLNKQVRDADEDWGSSIKTAPGETADFKVHLEIDNQDNTVHTVTVEDKLSSELTFQGGSIEIPEADISQTFTTWNGSYTFSVGPGEYNFYFNFSVTVEVVGLLENTVEAYDIDSPLIRLIDKVFLVSLWVHPDGTPQPGGAIVIRNLDKQVKHDFESLYQDSIITQTGRTLDFRITIDIENSYSTTKTVVLTDRLPDILSYIRNSSQGDLDIDKLFSQGGFLAIVTQPGFNAYEANFSATVKAEGSKSTSNRVQLYDNRFPFNQVVDLTPIYF